MRDSAGVTIVESTGGDRRLGEMPVQIGMLESDGTLEFVPWGFAADPDAGVVYVADRSESRVAVFDSAGGQMRELGRRGEGPGEFLEPAAVAVDDGVLAVLDARRGVVSRWSPEGALLDETRLPTPYWGPGLAMSDDWLVYVATTATGSRRDELLQVHRGGESQTVQTVSHELAMFESACGSAPAAPVLSPTPVWAGSAGTVYFAEGASYRIDVHRSQDGLSSFRRDLDPIPVSEQMARDVLAFAPGPYQAMMRQCDLDAGAVLSSVGYEPEISPIVGIAVDPAGRVWVARRTGSVMPEVVDLLAPTGEYLGTFELPAVPVAFLSDSRFVAVALNPVTGGLTAAIYELREHLGDMPQPRPGAFGERRAGERQAGRGVAPDAQSDPARELAPSANNPAGLREVQDCPECPVMVILPPGRFTMGAASPQDAEGDPATRPEWTKLAEQPPTEVVIDYPLAVGKYEVTFAEWDRCTAAGWCEYRPEDLGWGRGDRPAIFISRLDAEHYIEWLNSLTGRGYRLPSEAEWEYAARAGTSTARWWGDAVGSGHAVCNGCGSPWDDVSTAPVGSLPANPWGLHDVLGNASEWVADCWVDSHAGARTDGAPRIGESYWWSDGRCLRALQRGSSWGSYTWSVRAATRIGGHYGPDSRDYGDGFRIVRPVPEADTRQS